LAFREIAGSIVPESNPGDFNQAMMELGARICVPQNPNCDQCPIKKHCRASNQLQAYKSLAKHGFFNEKKRKHASISHGNKIHFYIISMYIFTTTCLTECTICDEIQSDLTEDDAYAVTR
jgi:A/G-specific adenine glycosylase